MAEIPGLIKLRVFPWQGEPFEVVAGMSERAKAERYFGPRMETVQTDYIAFVAWAAARRENLTVLEFEAWTDTIAQIEAEQGE